MQKFPLFCKVVLLLCGSVSSYHLASSCLKQLFLQEALSGGLAFLVRLSLLPFAIVAALYFLCDHQINTPLPSDCVSPTIRSQH